MDFISDRSRKAHVYRLVCLRSAGQTFCVVFLYLKYLKSLRASNTVAIRGIFGGGFNLESRNLGQAKLIASFPFQDFQNMMRAEVIIHYSL